MTEEEILRKKLDRLNKNSHYGIMIDTEITSIVRNLIKRLEDNEMKKATSVQNIKDVKDVSFSIDNHPAEMESKLTIVASTNDDIFAFEFEGPDIRQSCKAAGLFTGWEKDQKIRELEKELGDWKKEAADCLRIRDEVRREKNKEINKLKQQLQQAENDKKRLTYKLQENENLKKELALEKAANEAQHKFIREYAGKDTEVQFNYAIDDTEEVSYVIVEKRRNIIKENEYLRAEMKRLREENKDAVAESLKYIEINNKLRDENEELKYQLRDIQATKEVVEEKLNTRDNVNHPSHYTGRYECIDVMQDVFGDEATNDFCLCNAFKYIWRARKKNGLEDVKKAVWYLNKYIEEAEKDGVPKGK